MVPTKVIGPPFESLGDPQRGISLRPMRDADADYRLLSKWLSDERVLEWVEGRDQPYPLERVIAKYSPRVLKQEAVAPCFILLDGVPVGYLQYYPVTDAADYELESAQDTWAFDLFIGEPSLWSTGLGGEALRLILAYVFEECAAMRAIIDPRVENPRAIHAYEKLGFTKVKVLVGHEEHEGAMRDCWLMELRGRAVRGMNAPAGRNQLSTPIGGTQCERQHQGGMTVLNRRVVTPALVKLDWRI